jgi:tripartite-type tricarboxylate transporter receptor subunit TctC
MNVVVGVIALLAVMVLNLPATAETYPSKPIRFVVPFPPGGATDIVARVVGQKASESLGQPVVIENRPGAGGNMGADVAAKAAPDGYTMFMGTIATHAINASLYKNLSFDPIKDFSPVALLASVPLVLVVNAEVPAKSAQDVIALARAKPGELNYASPGSGTALHLAGELFKSMAGIDMVHVPYRGSAPAVTALIAGHVALMFDTTLSAMPHVEDGKLRALAVTTARRVPTLPYLPTIAEAGLAGFDVSAWNGVLVPAHTPDEIIKRLNAALVGALKAPEVRDRLLKQGAVPLGSTPEAFRAFIESESGKYAAIIKRAGIKAN